MIVDRAHRAADAPTLLPMVRRVQKRHALPCAIGCGIFHTAPMTSYATLPPSGDCDCPPDQRL
jgi:hypothetical protein